MQQDSLGSTVRNGQVQKNTQTQLLQLPMTFLKSYSVGLHTRPLPTDNARLSCLIFAWRLISSKASSSSSNTALVRKGPDNSGNGIYQNAHPTTGHEKFLCISGSIFSEDSFINKETYFPTPTHTKLIVFTMKIAKHRREIIITIYCFTPGRGLQSSALFNYPPT